MTHPVRQINFIDPGVVLIEASAGTGKTWTLERLYIKALLEATNPEEINSPVSVANILVVTFTNDAADELKSRILEQIQNTINLLIYLHHNLDSSVSMDDSDIFDSYLISRGQNSDYKKDITLLTRALQNFDTAAIYTIHGFCNKVIHDYSFECGVNPMFKLTASKSNLIEDLVLNFIRSKIINNDNLKADIDVVMNNLDRLFNSDDYTLTLQQRITARLPKDLFQLSKDGVRVKYTLNYAADLDLLKNTELTSEEKIAAKAGFFAALIGYLRVKYVDSNRNSNLLSYDELIGAVSVALQNSHGLKDKLFYSFPVAFIDEFQDTDNVQWQIFSYIYQLKLTNKVVGGPATKRGNLVVVGDPKQAIYRFRGADVDTYIEARQQIGNQLTLKHNFRSHPNILNFINQLFNLTNQNCTTTNSFLGAGIDYTTSISGVVDADVQSGVVTSSDTNISSTITTVENKCGVLPSIAELDMVMKKFAILRKFDTSEVQIVVIKGAKKEIRNNNLLMSMTFEILALLAANPKLISKIAILVTKNSEATKIVTYLRKYGVKAAELNLGNIFATDTANDLYLILSAIADLENRKIFMRALSCKLLNIPLINLMDNDNNSIVAKWQQRFFAFKQIWESSSVISLLYELINTIVTDHSNMNNEEPVFSNRELANIWQLAELINKQSGKVTNQTELLLWFKHKIDDASIGISNDLDGENEELVRLDNDDEQITITTQHKAKGMEYEILFCPYFKNSPELDGVKNYNYQRPLFSNYSYQGEKHSAMVLDKDIGNYILNHENSEIHRLNYVALTRAKSRIYIYLKQNTRDFRNPRKYSALEKPDKLIELFGYNKSNPDDNTHQLFNYPEFFIDPSRALKHPDKMPGVIAYARENLTEADLDKLRFTAQKTDANIDKFHHVNADFVCAFSYSRQSYTSITHKDFSPDYSDYYEKNESEQLASLKYRYSILNDPKLKSAVFGVLFHELCENYPFSPKYLATILNSYNIDCSNNDYVDQLTNMLDEAFSYTIPISSNAQSTGSSVRLNDRVIPRAVIPDLNVTSLDNESEIHTICLNDLTNKIPELKFNLLVKDTLCIKDEFCELIEDYFGVGHEFSLACKSLGQIESGFLVGAIDLLFEYGGKYWVLDYKTNKLDNYVSFTVGENNMDSQLTVNNMPVIVGNGSGVVADDGENINPLVESMAEHHYYLQYLLYLVAVKRYLESRLPIPDATDLIGGAVYYYVRGIYTDSKSNKKQGIYIDNNCNQLVAKIDKLLKSSKCE